MERNVAVSAFQAAAMCGFVPRFGVAFKEHPNRSFF
jgi:hypothetical protein